MMKAPPPSSRSISPAGWVILAGLLLGPVPAGAKTLASPGTTPTVFTTPSASATPAAAPSPIPTASPRPMTTPIPGSPEDTVADVAQRNISRFLANQVYQFDLFFGDSKLEDDLDNPWFRLRAGVEWKEGWEFKFKQRFRVYLPLPILKRRLGAFIGSDEDGRGKEPDYFETEERNPVAAGLRYFFRQHENFDANINIGALLRSGTPVVYTKPMVKGKFTWGRLYFEPRQYLFWYSDDGFGEETDLEFNYYLSRHFLFRFGPKVVYSNISSGVDFSQSFELGYLDYTTDDYPHFAIDLGWKSDGHTWPSAKFHQHQLALRFRHRIWRPWLRLEYGPRLTWTREVPGDDQDFPEYWKNHSPSFLVYIEILFEDLLGKEPTKAGS